MAEDKQKDILEAVAGLGEAIQDLANQVDQRINGLEVKFDQRFTKIEAVMVTKDYLDDKLTDLQGNLTVLMRKEDRKVAALIEVLKAKQLLSNEEAKLILSMEPFPQMY